MQNNLSLPININFSSFEKSHSFVDSFVHSNIVFEKTGKEIKEKIDQLLIRYSGKVLLLTKELGTLECPNVKPERDPSNWELGGYSPDDFINLPKHYSWEQRYGDDDGLTKPGYSMSGQTNTYPVDEETRKKMGKYNEVANKIVVCMTSSKIALTMKNGVSDNQNYKLSIAQLTSLGF